MSEQMSAPAERGDVGPTAIEDADLSEIGPVTMESLPLWLRWPAIAPADEQLARRVMDGPRMFAADSIRYIIDTLLAVSAAQASELERISRALAESGIGGIMDEFQSLPDAVTQMALYLADPSRAAAPDAGSAGGEEVEQVVDDAAAVLRSFKYGALADRLIAQLRSARAELAELEDATPLFNELVRQRDAARAALASPAPSGDAPTRELQARLVEEAARDRRIQVEDCRRTIADVEKYRPQYSDPDGVLATFREQAGTYQREADVLTALAASLRSIQPASPAPEAPSGWPSSAWPLRDTLARLVECADHLLGQHNCDHLGYETLNAARDVAKSWLASATVPEQTAPAPDEARLRQIEVRLASSPYAGLLDSEVRWMASELRRLQRPVPEQTAETPTVRPLSDDELNADERDGADSMALDAGLPECAECGDEAAAHPWMPEHQDHACPSSSVVGLTFYRAADRVAEGER